ncbi:Gly-Xaa carboxypeptidase [Cryptococcus neoformans A2-102-5]|nr:Gly-Xaa carboxypeptidase [Cryptococcus neoformans var. grubii AD1-83a]OWZ56548.1 Gly-Xaa carboxypeptidase [Cryptococcus neoformans var. grubii 125.91]OXG66028.1 Gly-Xaa carboxypeptidase [Cryptococcus neoformans var. grubii MW-RSA1955]OXG67682.1 Gly-Xaa carboxypeptidase [Cryptococcus neoformans var. grubii c8]OXG70765.1 Gly-Xaa carboxypeptidase [Cryptococcus neoformans var. grubii CHC193]OXG91366.1 Gly-Xaa carboxypeptidase [Cryptococcus neoformans var. grubii D17-1]OXG98761.1 Gly-Xaa carbox
MSEQKQSSALPLPIQLSTAYRPSWKPRILLGILFLLATAINFGPSLSSVSERASCLWDSSSYKFHDDLTTRFDIEQLKDWAKCPLQPKPIYPNMTWEMTEEERTRSIDHYAQAVRIPTQSYDDNGEPHEDPRWEPFFKFQDWLKETYPLAHEKATIEYINTLGILATFKGSDPTLKPLLLMSHYDVVPAPESTYDRWTYPPFSGHNDGTYVWGRGAADDKPLLVAQWEAITHLLENGFVPRRTIILSHGNDEEEVFARRGQGQIAPLLEKRYGKDGLLMVIDEGTGTVDDYYGSAFALPAMGEKGYMDIIITVGTAGGHSSVPPEHTGIGIMSRLLTSLEDNPFPTKLTPASPYLTALMCAAKHGSSFPSSLSSLLSSEGPTSYPKLAKALAKNSPLERALVRTTTAVDVVHGGVKVNALPELVTAMVNFRIDFAESLNSTKEHVKYLASRVAEKSGLELSAFDGRDVGELSGKFIKVEVMGLPLEPAPRTPTEGGVWELFAGTVKAAIPGPDGEERIVTPFASTGNTDCKMYYNLTKNVYRFMGTSFPGAENAHTVDEKGSIAGHLQIVKWIHAIVQNADAYTGEE